MGKASSPPRKLVERKIPSGLNSAWKLWRHCMCRNGFYPLAVAPFVTAAFVLDIYVSSGCDFVDVNIGMEPVNVAWTESTLNVGLFHYQTNLEAAPSKSLLMETFHPKCESYTTTFEEYFIDGDKTWKITQIIALVSGGAGCVATIIVWLMIITPLPSCFFWPGILLPAVLVELLAGSARFLLFDSQICQGNLWMPEEENAVAQGAKSCSISTDSWIAIVSSVLSLMNVLLICLRAPKRRKLNDNYGMEYKDVNNDMVNLKSDTMEDSTCRTSEQDVESQRTQNRTWRQNSCDLKPSYDLEEIVEQQMIGTNAEKQTERLTTRLSTKHSSQMKSVALKSSPIETQKPDYVKRAAMHSKKELDIIGTRNRNNSKYTTAFDENFTLPTVAEMRKTPSKATGKNLEDDPQSDSKPAPSDEGGFVFRSPLKAFKGTFSPRVLKSSKRKKQDNPVFASPKPYDEGIIFNCIDKLEKQFAEPCVAKGAES